MDLSGPGIDVKLKERKKERKTPLPNTTRVSIHVRHGETFVTNNNGNKEPKDDLKNQI